MTIKKAFPRNYLPGNKTLRLVRCYNNICILKYKLYFIYLSYY